MRIGSCLVSIACLAGAPCRPREPIGCCGVKEPDLSPALDGVRHASSRYPNCTADGRFAPPERRVSSGSRRTARFRQLRGPTNGRIRALDCTIQAATMAWTGGGIQPIGAAPGGRHDRHQEHRQRGPRGGRHLLTPIGPAHPCAADCAHESCHGGWFARKAQARRPGLLLRVRGLGHPARRPSSTPRDAYGSYRNDD